MLPVVPSSVSKANVVSDLLLQSLLPLATVGMGWLFKDPWD